MRRPALIVLGLAGLQALLVALYLGAERWRAAREPLRYERESRAAPELVYRTRDGREHQLSELRGRPVLVHFWATWCPPCLEELPAVLRLAGEGAPRVLAVSLDADWAPVERFVGGKPPPSVVLADGSASADGFGFESLPHTFLIDGAGRLRLRFAGPRDWLSDEMRGLLGTESRAGEAPAR